LFNLLAVLLSELILCFESSLRGYVSQPAAGMLFGSLLGVSHSLLEQIPSQY
jgi:hypothetical protein